MKKIQMIMTTSHIDRHGEKLSQEALEDLVSQINERYMPININHDIRRPIIGRVVSAELIKLPDGETAVLGTGELFDESDNLETLLGDGRKIEVQCKNIEIISINYERSFLNKEGQEFLHELSQISKEEPVYQMKKAVEPISTLIIYAGIFIVGAIATGFLRKIGYDLYDRLKKTLIKYYRKKIHPDQILDLCFLIKHDTNNFETHILIDNPTEKKLNNLFDTKFEDVDTLIVSLPIDKTKDIAKLVLEYTDKKLSILYAIRSDAVPFTFKKYEIKIE